MFTLMEFKNTLQPLNSLKTSTMEQKKRIIYLNNENIRIKSSVSYRKKNTNTATRTKSLQPILYVTQQKVNLLHH